MIKPIVLSCAAVLICEAALKKNMKIKIKSAHIHHSLIGWGILTLYFIINWLSCLYVGLTLIVHHIIRERKVFY